MVSFLLDQRDIIDNLCIILYLFKEMKPLRRPKENGTKWSEGRHHIIIANPTEGKGERYVGARLHSFHSFHRSMIIGIAFIRI